MGHLAQLVFEVGGLLALIALLPRAAQALRLPAPVLLAALGVALALIASLDLGGIGGFFEPLFDFVGGFRALPVTADLFLWVFLPLLLFETAIALDGRALIEELGPVLILAVVAVVVSTLLAGFAVYAASGHGLVVCLLLAAIVATTDPSAVVAIFREVGAPQRLSLLVEGESLLNDAAAIALFTLFLGALLAPGNLALSSATLEFSTAFVVGGALGAALGRLASLCLGRLDRGGPAEVTMSVALAYLAYALSYAYFGASGVVATVTAGLVFGSAARSRLTGEEWQALRAIWGQVGFWASSLVFVLAAALIPKSLANLQGSDLIALSALLAGSFVARALVVFAVMPMVAQASGRPPLDRAYRLVILWGGLRGAVTLALALSIVENPRVPAEVQHFVSALATGFVLFTLLVQGPSLRPLIHRLGLDRLGPVEQLLHARALEIARAELRDRLSLAAIRHGLELGRLEAIAEVLPPAVPAPEAGAVGAGRRDELIAALATVTSREIELYLAELAEGTVARASGTTLVRRSGELLDALRLQGVHGYRHVARRQDEPDTATRMAAWLHLRLGVAQPLARRLQARLEILLARRRVLEDLLGFTKNRVRRLFGERIAAVVAQVLEERLEGTERQLDALRLQFPDHYERAAGRYLARLALQLEARDYERLLAERLLSAEVFRLLRADLERRQRLIERTPPLDLGLDPDRLMARVPLLAALPPERRAELRRALRPRLALPGERIVRRGERGDAVYFIASGAVEVQLEGTTVRLGTGDVFGEMALLLHQPRRADVVAIGYCRLLVLGRDAFRRFLRRHPELWESLRQIARKRLHSRGELESDSKGEGEAHRRAAS